MLTILPTTTADERAKVKAHLKEIYDAYRSASMNCTYYERQLKKTHCIAKAFEIGLAVLNSSAVAAWVIWKEGFGTTLWKILSGFAVVVAIIHPILKISVEIERLTKQRTGYNDLFHDLRVVVRDIQIAQSISTQDWKRFKEIDANIKKLAEKDDLSPSKKELRKIMKEVLHEIPTDSLWYPKNASAQKENDNAARQ